jgi:hypothetical protein
VERRAWVRFPSDATASCSSSLTGSQARWNARIYDICQGGIRLVSTRRFERGTMLEVMLGSLAAGTARSLLAKVVHVSGPTAGKWSMGCAFLPPLSESELDEILR